MHIPVLLQEVVSGLAVKRGATVLDATVGDGGMSEALCAAMEGRGTIVCLDEDEEAISRSRARLTACGCEFLFYRANFRNLDDAFLALGILEIGAAVFDLGLSSFQLEESGRGFSFQRDEPLLMTFHTGSGLTAQEIVNQWDEKRLAAVLRECGEERFAARIARKIIAARHRGQIETSGALAEIIFRAVRRRGRIHPATRTFQALRITVNDEPGALKEALPKCFSFLSRGGRMAVISYHSGEDRLVKHFFRDTTRGGAGRLIFKKPVTPAQEEMRRNPRSRSAKLRILEKL
ncbi:MAG: 16S rRNA (cytosine1402-N4)-methyltransferase [Parcubacteria group bacterium Greene0416_79]|nr:MAG: 16S rRNA (cytosine1402-N4)-methyltransferase [Parcubacteria group bacterium Greene0416_79]